MKIVILCVNYNNSKEVIQFINMFTKSKNFKEFNFVIVDNSNNNNEFIVLKDNLSKFNNIYIFNSTENLGYLNGMNYGFEKYKNKKELYPEWIIVANTDLKFDVDKLYNEIIEETEKCILAPKIISTFQGNNQNPFLVNRPKKRKLIMLKIIFSNLILSSIYSYMSFIKNKIKFKEKTILKNNFYIYAPHGSFIIFNKKFFELGGKLKYKPFLFGEEIYIGEQAKQIGINVKYKDDIEIFHNEHSTTSLLNKKRTYIFKKESTKFIIKYLYDWEK